MALRSLPVVVASRPQGVVVALRSLLVVRAASLLQMRWRAGAATACARGVLAPSILKAALLKNVDLVCY